MQVLFKHSNLIFSVSSMRNIFIWHIAYNSIVLPNKLSFKWRIFIITLDWFWRKEETLHLNSVQIMLRNMAIQDWSHCRNKQTVFPRLCMPFSAWHQLPCFIVFTSLASWIVIKLGSRNGNSEFVQLWQL